MAGEMNWYVVHTYSGYENAVSEAIQQTVENRDMYKFIEAVTIPVEIRAVAEPVRREHVDDGMYHDYDDVDRSQVQAAEPEEPEESDELVIPAEPEEPQEPEEDSEKSKGKKKAAKPKPKKEKKVRTIESKLYPGYVLVKMDMNDEVRHIVRNIRGVTGFVGADNDPIPLTEEEAIAMLAEEQKVVIRDRMKKKDAAKDESAPKDETGAEAAQAAENAENAESAGQAAAAQKQEETPKETAPAPKPAAKPAPVKHYVINFKVGDSVMVNSGVMSGHVGEVLEIDKEHGKVRIRIQKFTVETDLDQVEVAW